MFSEKIFSEKDGVFEDYDIQISGGRDYTNMLFFRHPKVRGELFITFPESEDDGIPEVDYDSNTTVGEGNPEDIWNAIKLTKMSINIFREKTGYTGKIKYCPDNRDGFGDKRFKLFKRYLPELMGGDSVEK